MWQYDFDFFWSKHYTICSQLFIFFMIMETPDLELHEEITQKLTTLVNCFENKKNVIKRDEMLPPTMENNDWEIIYTSKKNVWRTILWDIESGESTITLCKIYEKNTNDTSWTLLYNQVSLSNKDDEVVKEIYFDEEKKLIWFIHTDLEKTNNELDQMLEAINTLRSTQVWNNVDDNTANILKAENNHKEID